jgi:hypothetical protein
MAETFCDAATLSPVEDMTMKAKPGISRVTLLMILSACSTQAIDVGSTVVDGGEPSSDGGSSSLSPGGVGGVATGGVATGGVATGGVATGGVATGGVATGGAPVTGGSGGNLPGGAGGAGGLVTGGAGGAGGATGLPSCAGALVATSENNYSALSTLSFPVIKVKPGSDLLFDWSGATADFTRHAMNPSTDIRLVAVLMFNLTPQVLQAKLNSDIVMASDLVVTPPSLLVHGQTTVRLSDLTLGGSTIALDVLLQYFDASSYPPSSNTYALVVQTGTVLFQDIQMMQFFQLDPASTNTVVKVMPDSASLTFFADLHTLALTRMPVGTPTGSLDFRSLSWTATGSQFNAGSVTSAFIGHYAESPRELEEKFLDLETIAIDLYRTTPSGAGIVDLSTMVTKANKSFTGITPTGTWLLGLQCDSCLNPTPPYITVLAPCAAQLGATCSLGPGVTPSPSVATYSEAAPECGTGLCVKPALESSASPEVDTAPFCTWACTQDSDCAGGALRGSDPGTKSCVSGYACGIAFVKGKQCCRSMCLCRDFTGPGPIQTPIACQGDAAATCDQ